MTRRLRVGTALAVAVAGSLVGCGGLVALEPPENERSEVTKLDEEAEHGLATVHEIAGDRVAAERALQSQTDGFDGFRRQAAELGLDRCAGDADPASE